MAGVGFIADVQIHKWYPPERMTAFKVIATYYEEQISAILPTLKIDLNNWPLSYHHIQNWRSFLKPGHMGDFEARKRVGTIEIVRSKWRIII